MYFSCCYFGLKEDYVGVFEDDDVIVIWGFWEFEKMICRGGVKW